jgi:programmed cell death protein 5
MDEQEYQKLLQQQQMEVVKKAALLKFMSKEARERLNRIKVVKPEIAEKIELALLQALQLGQIKEELSDEQLKQILQEVSQKKDFNLKIYKK